MDEEVKRYLRICLFQNDFAYCNKDYGKYENVIRAFLKFYVLQIVAREVVHGDSSHEIIKRKISIVSNFLI